MLPIKPDVIKDIKKIDLLTYLKNNDPDELIKVSRDTYSTKTHDSLKINNGKWFWFSRGIGGYSALDYLIKVKDYSFLQAANELVKYINVEIPIYYNNEHISKTKLILPKKNKNNNIIISYLIERGIDIEIIDYLIENDLIYEEKSSHNIVFIGTDYNKIPRYAFIRSTNEKRFMHDASGSEKEYSFRLLSKTYNDKIHIFESAIDLLSYATILKMNNRDFKKENLIALSGVYQSSSNSKIPCAIKKYLENNRHIKKIFLHLDNDSVGRNATNNLILNLQNEYEVIDGKPFEGKDWNDFLLITINKNLKER